MVLDPPPHVEALDLRGQEQNAFKVSHSSCGWQGLRASSAAVQAYMQVPAQLSCALALCPAVPQGATPLTLCPHPLSISAPARPGRPTGATRTGRSCRSWHHTPVGRFGERTADGACCRSRALQAATGMRNQPRLRNPSTLASCIAGLCMNTSRGQAAAAQASSPIQCKPITPASPPPAPPPCSTATLQALTTSWPPSARQSTRRAAEAPPTQSRARRGLE